MTDSILYPDPPRSLPRFEAIRSHLLANEAETVSELLKLASVDDAMAKQIHAYTLSLGRNVRQVAARNHFDAFLQSYGLGTEEGIALMALAEALLRIPDNDTADRLIQDLLKDRDWRRSQTATWLVNAASRALMFTDFWIDASEGKHWFDRLLRKLGEPVLRTAMKAGMRVMAQHFVVGETINEALANADPKYRYSYDMLGEAALTAEDAERYFESYQAAIAALARHPDSNKGFGRPSISVKLSAIHPRYEFGQSKRVMAELGEKLMALAVQAAEADLVFTVDAEESERLEISLQLMEKIIRSHKIDGWNGFGLAVQAYQRRAPFVIDWLADLGRDTGRALPVRLVKGAYWDSEIKRAQQMGLDDYPVYTRKSHTDVAYLACARKMLEYGDVFYPQFASHNAHTLAWLMEFTRGRERRFEIQRLHGMGEELHRLLVEQEGVPSRIYAPVGEFHSLLPYLVRRLLENGANSSFVHMLADTRVPLEKIATDPVREVASQPITPGVKAPSQVFAPRQNSKGFSMSDTTVLQEVRQHLSQDKQWDAAPIVGGQISEGQRHPRFNPADQGQEIGGLINSTAADVEHALKLADDAVDEWRHTSVAARAEMLERAADLLEKHRDEFLHLLVKEGGKALPDALGEFREAVDYCRFYAMEARRLFIVPISLPGVTGESNELRLIGRGVFVCVAPWNFPLAIFLGQVAAALAAGNTVLAKPSRRTPLVGMRAIQMLLEAGVPGKVLHYLPGESGSLSKLLLGDSRVAGVAFTGSTNAAWTINRQLAARNSQIASLIAETGGINAMIADSSAHVEQLILDVLTSAFNSAGQRCSALRILLVQDDIADAVAHRLGQAMRELKIGNPIQLSSDIGPAIDRSSQRDLNAYIEKMSREAKLIGSTPLPAGTEAGCFVAPHAFEVSLDQLPREEVFGPVLHLARFKGEALEDAVKAVNALGFGLTMGVHTRLDSTVETVRRLAQVGNLYINRNQIGAVVGSQPFGGEGLSGTGFKAGGPHYLLKFASERTFTVNTAAVGGNVRLMSGGDDSA